MKTTKSTWEELKKSKARPALAQTLSADVVIVGGGMAGILSAYLLSKEGFRVVVLESEKLLSGATSYTTAFITQSIDTDLADQIKIYGAKGTKLIWQSHGRAIDLIEEIVQKEKIDCEFKRCSNYAYANTAEDFQYLIEEQEVSEKLGFNTRLYRKNSLNFPNGGYLETKNQAKFHPTKFLQKVIDIAEKNGVQFFEDSEVLALSGKKLITAQTKRGKVVAKQAIIATYKPFNRPKETFLKKGMYVSYVFEVAVAKGRFKEGIYEDTENPYHYFRIDRGKKKDRMIIGGEDHRAELQLSDQSFKALEKYLKKIMDGRPYTITKKWKGPILEPSDGLALIGRIKPNQLVATAFSGNGMTYSAITAMLLRDILIGKKNSWAKLYDPERIPGPKRLITKGRDYLEELYRGAIKNSLKN